MYSLVKELAILPIKKFIKPGQEHCLVINDKAFFKAIEEYCQHSRRLGIPFWFNGKFNVFGIEVEINKIYKNNSTGFMRVWVKGIKFFRISEYSKSAGLDKLPAAKIEYLNYMEKPPANVEITRLFEKYCNAVLFVDDIDVKLSNIFQHLDLGPEISFSIISQRDSQAREELLLNVLKYQYQILRQQKTFGLN